MRVAGPYVAWSVVYLAALWPEPLPSCLWKLLTGGASAQMYYLLVYAQLTVLSPLLLRLLRSHRMLLYMVTPISTALWELSAAAGVDLPNLGRLFPMWLVYYLFGLEWGKWRERLRKKGRSVAAVAALALLAQMGEGALWYAHGDHNMATTQLRLTNVLSSLAVITLLMTAVGKARERLSGCNPLVLLGDLSFGVYLCHIAVLMVLGKVLALAGIEGVASSFILWLGVIVGSVLLVRVCREVLPRRALTLLGFE